MADSGSKLAFFKRTRKGKVIKLAKEKYLRSDIKCGYLRGALQSEKDLRSLVQVNSNKHICVVDTNICLHEIDVLEFRSSDPLVVVILQTVLQEVKNLNLSVYKRLSELLADETRFFIFYPNEVSSATMVERGDHESSNDFNDRRIRVAAVHFQETLGRGGAGKAILLTHDKKNRVSGTTTCCIRNMFVANSSC